MLIREAGQHRIRPDGTPFRTVAIGVVHLRLYNPFGIDLRRLVRFLCHLARRVVFVEAWEPITVPQRC